MIGEGIKIARERVGKTQADVAALIGTDASHVAHWESGRRDPSLSNVIALADAFGCSIDSLVGRDPEFSDGFRRGYFECREQMKRATKTALVEKIRR